MPNLTSNFSFNKPLVNDATDADLWGGQLNTNWDAIDVDLAHTTASKTASFTVGTGEYNYTYLINASGAAVTATLPAAADVFNGFTVRFTVTDATNTITIDGNGSETIDGSATLTLSGETLEVTCDGSNWHSINQIKDGSVTSAKIASGILANLISGMNVSNGTDADHDIDFTAGTSILDGTTVTTTATITKRFDATWVEGSGNGGLDTGTLQADDTLHLFSIRKDSDGTGDFLGSHSLSPTVPSGWTLIQRLHSIPTDASANLYGFTQNGKTILYNTVKNGTFSVTSTASLASLTVPNDIKVEAKTRANLFHSGSVQALLITSPDENDQTTSTGGLASLTNTVNNGRVSGEFDVITNTSGQIRLRGSATLSSVQVYTYGWEDFNLVRI